MPRLTIQQFRATLDGRTDAGTLVRAYREITRQPELAVGAGFAGWGDWTTPPGALVRASREITRRPELASGVGFATWGEWATPPGAARN